MREFYETSYANVHRGVYTLAERATAGSRARARRCARSSTRRRRREIIFVRNATEALNLVAYSWGLDNLGPGDVVVVTELEHHSNFVPWQYIAKQTGAQFAHDPARRLRRARARRARRDRDAAATSRSSRRTSSRTRSARSTRSRSSPRWAHEQGAIFVCRRRAGRAAHARSTCRRSAATSSRSPSHKLCGPSGIGALWGRRELLEAMQPFLPRRPHDPLGRARAARAGASCRTSSRRARAPIAEAVGFGAAIDYSRGVGLDAIEAHEHELVAYALGRARRDPRHHALRPAGRAPRRHRRRSTLEGIHPHDVAQILDWEGVADPRRPPLHASR